MTKKQAGQKLLTCQQERLQQQFIRQHNRQHKLMKNLWDLASDDLAKFHETIKSTPTLTVNAIYTENVGTLLHHVIACHALFPHKSELLLKVVRCLVAKKIEINKTNSVGVTAIMLATDRDNIELFHLLKSMGADLHYRDNRGFSLIHRAANKNARKLLTWLITEEKFDVNDNKPINTPLLLAANKGCTDAVQSLIQANADLNGHNKNGITALFYAARNRHYQVVALILRSIADSIIPDRDQKLSVENFDMEQSLNMIAQNPDIENNLPRLEKLANAFTYEYIKAQEREKLIDDLFAAAEHDLAWFHQEILAITDNSIFHEHDTNDNLLMDAVLNNQNYDMASTLKKEIIYHLCNKICDTDITHAISSQDSELIWLTITIAITLNDLEKIKSLRKNSALINFTSNNGLTPLHYAAEKTSQEVLAWLIEEKADLDRQDNEGKTPLHKAAKYNNYDAVKLLVSGHADINRQDDLECTALQLATDVRIKELLKAITKSDNIQKNERQLNLLLHTIAEKIPEESQKTPILSGDDDKEEEDNDETFMSAPQTYQWFERLSKRTWSSKPQAFKKDNNSSRISPSRATFFQAKFTSKAGIPAETQNYIVKIKNEFILLAEIHGINNLKFLQSPTRFIFDNKQQIDEDTVKKCEQSFARLSGFHVKIISEQTIRTERQKSQFMRLYYENAIKNAVPLPNLSRVKETIQNDHHTNSCLSACPAM